MRRSSRSFSRPARVRRGRSKGGERPGQASTTGRRRERGAVGRSLCNLVKPRSLPTLRKKLIQIGAKVVAHLRQVIFQMAEAAVPRALFATIGNRFRLRRAV